MEKKETKYEKKKGIIKRYNSSAAYYDSRYKDIQFRKFKISLEIIKLRERIILDAGCGTGLLYEFLYQTHRFWGKGCSHIINTDISIEMIKIFQEKLRERGIKSSTENIFKQQKSLHHLVIADAENLPFRPCQFDIILSFTMIQNLSDNKKFFRKIHDIIKNEGDVLLSLIKKKKEDIKLFYSLFNNSNKLFQKEYEILDQEDFIFIGKGIKK